MNQVYFYLRNAQTIMAVGLHRSLNPFMNQVYFYIAEQMDNVRQEKRQVLIPL